MNDKHQEIIKIMTDVYFDHVKPYYEAKQCTRFYNGLVTLKKYYELMDDKMIHIYMESKVKDDNNTL